MYKKFKNFLLGQNTGRWILRGDVESGENVKNVEKNSYVIMKWLLHFSLEYKLQFFDRIQANFV